MACSKGWGKSIAVLRACVRVCVYVRTRVLTPAEKVFYPWLPSGGPGGKK